MRDDAGATVLTFCLHVSWLSSFASLCFVTTKCSSVVGVIPFPSLSPEWHNDARGPRARAEAEFTGTTRAREYREQKTYYDRSLILHSSIRFLHSFLLLNLEPSFIAVSPLVSLKESWRDERLCPDGGVEERCGSVWVGCGGVVVEKEDEKSRKEERRKEDEPTRGRKNWKESYC